jgi:hypothetical protein
MMLSCACLGCVGGAAPRKSFHLCQAGRSCTMVIKYKTSYQVSTRRVSVK